MAINLVVAITDYDWFRALQVREDWPEVNFWAPFGTNFRALQPGELFLFKLHAPRNFIVGGGVFAQAMTLPCSLAWETFKEANGAGDLAQMRARILRYRNADHDDRTDFPIGCRILDSGLFQKRRGMASGSCGLADPHPKRSRPTQLTVKTVSNFGNGRTTQSPSRSAALPRSGCALASPH